MFFAGSSDACYPTILVDGEAATNEGPQGLGLNNLNDVIFDVPYPKLRVLEKKTKDPHKSNKSNPKEIESYKIFSGDLWCFFWRLGNS